SGLPGKKPPVPPRLRRPPKRLRKRRRKRKKKRLLRPVRLKRLLSKLLPKPKRLPLPRLKKPKLRQMKRLPAKSPKTPDPVRYFPNPFLAYDAKELDFSRIYIPQSRPEGRGGSGARV